MTKKRLLLTGIAGFVGSHICEGVLKDTDWEIVGLDNLNYASNLARLTDMDIWERERNRVKFVWWDLKTELNEQIIEDIGKVDYVFHLAANSHVDRSIKDPISFLMDNTLGTVNLLEYTRKVSPQKIIIFSTDESFGPTPDKINFKEGTRHNPGNPYAASKASAEDFSIAYTNTYKMPIMITNTMNIYGERQHPEKYIPTIIKKVLNGEQLTVHNGSRFWIHARRVCQALIFLTEKVDEFLDIEDVSKGKFNVVGEVEKTNLELAQFIAKIIGKSLKYKLVDTRECRPGHDKRYGLDGSKLKNLGFRYPLSFEESLTKTVNWYFKGDNKKWL